MLLLYTWTNLYQKCANKNFRCSLDSPHVRNDEIPRSNWKLYIMYKDLAIATDEFLLPLFRSVISVQRHYMTKLKYGKLKFINDVNYIMY